MAFVPHTPHLGMPKIADSLPASSAAGSVRTGTYGDIGNEAREVYRGQYQGAGDLAELVRTGAYRDAGGIAEDVHKGQYRGANGIAEEVYKGQYKDTGTIDYSADRQRVEDALMARINPQLDRDRAALETKLANQGIMVGSQAWNDAIDSANRASTDARNSAIANAGAEQSRLFGISPVDLATVISYETGGTFDPTQAGPRTKWGQHRGLIQFGEPQAKQYGVDWRPQHPLRHRLRLPRRLPAWSASRRPCRSRTASSRRRCGS